MKEFQIQIAVASFFRDVEEKLGNMTFFHVPNGGLRSKAAASKLKAMGVRAGVHDLVFLGREGKTILVELKALKGDLNPNQKAFHGLVTALGHASYCVSAKDGKEAITTITGILKAHGLVQGL